jgi:hypothetical protein
MALATIAFGIGFLGIFFDGRRRAWDDRLSRTDVVYEGHERKPAPWSRLEVLEPVAAEVPSTTKAPETRGLRTQRVAGSSSS